MIAKTYFELLLHILDYSLAVETNIRGADKFRVDRMSANHLAWYLEKSANAGSFQVSYFIFWTDFNKTNVQFLLYIEISFVPYIAVHSSAQEWVNPVKKKKFWNWKQCISSLQTYSIQKQWWWQGCCCISRYPDSWPEEYFARAWLIL